ncbi:metallophosphoesterase [Salipiger sp. PrR003]|uniref:metallophosphoesterase family protein n=1 Tax=Salipiger sp. PrR003 TaxID=2706776 RepID=UPI0013DB5DBD|nr:metallophosphoesterase [Salipiger sp. PrR003]NDV52869.1 hypothetical protein [Salipiger sp. PrR003]
MIANSENVAELKLETGASGFLFVGDPHVSVRRPGRRKDDDYQTTILNKLAEAVRIANDHNYVMVILGDLLDEPVPGSESLKNRLIRILKSARFKVVNLLGNHERTHAKLSDDDTLSLLESSGAFDLIKQTGPYGVFDFEGTRIGLGGTPYGEDIPTDVSGMFPDCKSVVWITHHDLAFEGAYPGSRPLHEIKGCKLAVNGHMHLMKKIRREGETTWFNPGNITRQAVDAMEHIPRVWGFDRNGKIEPFDLTHRKDAFDLTGRLISSIMEDSAPEEEGSMESVFVQLIQVEESADFSKTDDGTVIREQMETLFDESNTDTKVRSLVVGLLNEVVESEKAAA